MSRTWSRCSPHGFYLVDDGSAKAWSLSASVRPPHNVTTDARALYDDTRNEIATLVSMAMRPGTSTHKHAATRRLR
jgi:hypothetical protein